MALVTTYAWQWKDKERNSGNNGMKADKEQEHVGIV